MAQEAGRLPRSRAAGQAGTQAAEPPDEQVDVLPFALKRNPRGVGVGVADVAWMPPKIAAKKAAVKPAAKPAGKAAAKAQRAKRRDPGVCGVHAIARAHTCSKHANLPIRHAPVSLMLLTRTAKWTAKSAEDIEHSALSFSEDGGGPWATV